MYKYLAFGLPLVLVSLWLGFGQGENMKLAEKSAANKESNKLDTLSNVVVSTNKLKNDQDILMEEVISTNGIIQNTPPAPLPIQRKNAAPKKEMKASANLPEKKDKPDKEKKQKPVKQKHQKNPMKHEEKIKPEKKDKDKEIHPPKPVKDKPPADKPDVTDKPKPEPEEKPKPPKEDEGVTNPADGDNGDKPLPDDSGNLESQSTNETQSVKSVEDK